MPNMRGRRPKLTRFRVKAVLLALEWGATMEQAAEAAGIARRTIYNWMDRGENEVTGPFAEFLHAKRAAEAIAEARALAIIQRAATGGEPITKTRRAPAPDGTIAETITAGLSLPDWKAAAWLLERRWPARWGLNREPVARKLAKATFGSGRGPRQRDSR